MVTMRIAPPASDPPASWRHLTSSAVPVVLAGITLLILLGLSWPANVVVLVGTVVGVLAVRWPEVGLTAMAIAIPLQNRVQGRVGSDDVTFSDAVVVAILCAWVLRLALTRCWPSLSPLAAAYGAHVGVVCLSVFVARQSSLWSIEATQWVMGFGVYLLAHDVLARHRRA